MTERFRDLHKAFREQEIQRTAAEVVAEVGCRALTMNEVAARLGVSKATLYQHFESRESMIRRAVGDSCAAVLKEADALVQDVPAPDRVRRIAVLLVARCLGIRRGEDGAAPVCCLVEIDCPYVDWRLLDGLFPVYPRLGDQPARLGLARRIQALSAVVVAQRKAEGSEPDQADADAIVSLLFPQD